VSISRDESIEIDHAIVVCNGCQKVTTHEFATPFTSAKAFVAWMKTLKPCDDCGGVTADVKAHIKPASKDAT
jgi:hypothetical protein